MADKKDKRRGLGRGLSALMSDVEPISATSIDERPQPDRLVPIEKIAPNPDQPRRSFSGTQLEELTDSVRTKGILQPLILRPDPNNADRYQIVAGERRWRAAQRAQLHEVPAIIRSFSDTEVLEVAIIENIQRADLNAIEEAAGYRQLMDRFGHTQEKLAESLGKSRSHIANLLRLLTLPDSVQEMVASGALSAGHARAMVTAVSPEDLAHTVVKKGLSVRETEALSKGGRPGRGGQGTAKKSARIKDADTKALEGDLSAALGMSVEINHAPGQEAGRLTVSYDTLEQLDALCGILSAVK
jgi:ParB family chromosome partitioning protein